ncbi:CHAT domain-containing tetratricopeptide repeat protein [Streptomyces griseosporeus]|uniref:CHAT domain-containing tetratricopeptide repeat protein n=1 Tax=Streptomyces griseosporeus TaxID=1910 RepID=UPI0036D1887B
MRQLVFSQNWDDVRRAIDAHPELVSDTSLELLDRMIEQLRAGGELDGARQYERYLDLLVLTRQVGVDDAIAETIGDDQPPELRAALAPLVESFTAGQAVPEQLGLIRRALDAASPDTTPRIWGSLHGLLGEALLDDRTGDRDRNVEEALDALRTALGRLSRGARPVLWALTMSNLARAYAERERGTPEENEARALAAFRRALAVFTDDAGPRIIAVDMERYLLLTAVGSGTGLRHAIDLLRRALTHIHDSVTADRPVDLPRLAQLVDEVSISLDDGEDIAEPNDDLREETRTGDPVWDRALAGTVLLGEYWKSDEPDALLRALNLLESAARSVDASSPRRGSILALLGNALWSYHVRVHDPAVREQAIGAHRQAIALLPPESPTRIAALAALAEELYLRHLETDEPGDLNEAIELVEQAARSVPSDAPQRPVYLRQSGDYRLARHASGGESANLVAALEALRAAERLTPPGSPDRLKVLVSLSSALAARYEETGDPADLGQAIDCDREALRLTPDRSAARVAVLQSLGNNFQSRNARTGRPEDLDQAIAYARQALALVPATAPVRAELLLQLGLALNLRHDLRQEADDLTKSIALVREAVELCPPGSDYRHVTLNALSGVLRDRYFRTGDLSDLAESIDLSRAAVDEAPPGSPRWGHLINLGIALRQRYARSRELSDLDEAIAQWREAYDGISRSRTAGLRTIRLSVLVGLSVALLDRYEHTRDGRHLQQATELAREAWDLSTSSTGVDVNIANLLASALLDGFWRDRDLRALHEAETVLRQALAVDGSSVHGRMFLPSNLARVLSTRWAAEGTGGDTAVLDEGRALFRRAVTAGLVLNPELARVDSRAWGGWAALRGSWSEAAEAYGHGLRAMEQLFRAQLTRTTKELRLRDAQGLAVDAAYALARSGDTAEAAVALERGRALLLSEALERSRARLEELAAAGHGELVERFRRGNEALTGLEQRALAEGSEPEPFLPRAAPGPDSGVSDALRAARAELDTVVAAIRQVPGYERFLDPPRFDDVRAAATTPLVYLAAAEQSGFALVVSGDRVDVCWLPSLTEGALRALVETYLRAYRARRTAPRAWEETLDTTTRRLWDLVMEPVVAALAPAGRAALVPAGLLGLLPLHAAWREDATAPSGRRYALDDVLLTYVPNARARLAAAEAARGAGTDGLLAVDDPRPVTAGPLPAAGREVQAALGHFPRTRRLGGDRATLEAVGAALGRHPVLHFACHGFADVAEPLESGLLLADDQPLTLRDLLRLGPLNARLAVLSACETAVPGTDLPDEVVSLPTGLLQAGAAGVVASLWSVSDTGTMALLARFYALWRSEGLDPPEALRRAQQWVRDTPNGVKRDLFPDIAELSGDGVPVSARSWWERARAHASPFYWAAFVYVGE